MPAKAPPPNHDAAIRLLALGAQIRAHRKRLRVSGTATAEAAGLARVTLHRIERGEPSVTMGAYLNVMAALGLGFTVDSPGGALAAARTAGKGEANTVPDFIKLSEFPQLRRIAWHVRGLDALTPAEALSLYERSARHLDWQAMEPRERDLVEALRRSVRADEPQAV